MQTQKNWGLSPDSIQTVLASCPSVSHLSVPVSSFVSEAEITVHRFSTPWGSVPLTPMWFRGQLYIQKDAYPDTSGEGQGLLGLLVKRGCLLMFSHENAPVTKQRKTCFSKESTSNTRLPLQTYQFLLDLLCASIELHIILMSQEAPRNKKIWVAFSVYGHKEFCRG